MLIPLTLLAVNGCSGSEGANASGGDGDAGGRTNSGGGTNIVGMGDGDAPGVGGSNEDPIGTGGGNVGGDGDAPGAGGSIGDPTGTGGGNVGGDGDATGGSTQVGDGDDDGTTNNPDCFPPITDFAARDGGFSAAEREIVDIGGDSVSLFRPADANFGQDACQHPLIVWGNGSTNTVDIWAGHLSRVSTFGFIVVAPEQTQVNSGHMDAALDYVIGLSEDPASPYFGKVDATKLGSSGYSLGGAGAMGVASDARIGATFIWDSFGNCANLHGPFGTIVASEGLGDMGIIDNCSHPAFAMEAAGADHVSVLSFPGGFGGPPSYAQEGYVGWFRWHFMGDPAAEALFVGDTCGFCAREGITVATNGI